MKMAKYDIATPYTAVYLVIRKDERVAFVLRQNTDWMNGFYSLPAGKVEKGESFTAAAVREAHEETGISVSPENLRALITVHRNSPDSLWVDMCFEVLQWEGEPYNAEPHVHSELTWFDPRELPENVIPETRFLLQEIEAGKRYTEYGWDVTASNN